MQPEWDHHERLAVMTVLEGDYLNEGEYVRKFERMFADYVGARHCILVPNGSLALWLAIESGPFIEHTFPDYYSIFVANAVMNFSGWHFNISDSTEGCTIPVHVNGRITDTSNAVIEDCCQAPFHHTKGIVSCYSFHSTKLLTCGGIGGAVCLDDDNLYERMSAIKDHGRPERSQHKPVTDYHSTWGTNLKMPDICAAFGIEQLKKLPARLERVRKEYERCQSELKDVEWLGVPSWRVDCLTDKDIGKRFYTPTHRQPRFQLPDERFPRTMELYRKGRYLT